MSEIQEVKGESADERDSGENVDVDGGENSQAIRRFGKPPFDYTLRPLKNVGDSHYQMEKDGEIVGRVWYQSPGDESGAFGGKYGGFTSDMGGLFCGEVGAAEHLLYKKFPDLYKTAARAVYPDGGDDLGGGSDLELAPPMELASPIVEEAQVVEKAKTVEKAETVEDVAKSPSAPEMTFKKAKEKTDREKTARGAKSQSKAFTSVRLSDLMEE